MALAAPCLITAAGPRPSCSHTSTIAMNTDIPRQAAPYLGPPCREVRIRHERSSCSATCPLYANQGLAPASRSAWARSSVRSSSGPRRSWRGRWPASCKDRRNADDLGAAGASVAGARGVLLGQPGGLPGPGEGLVRCSVPGRPLHPGPSPEQLHGWPVFMRWARPPGLPASGRQKGVERPVVPRHARMRWCTR
jgi:hypothetical protein